MTESELNEYKAYVIRLIEALYDKAIRKVIEARARAVGANAEMEAYKKALDDEDYSGGSMFSSKELADQRFGSRGRVYESGLKAGEKEREFLKNVLLVASVTFATKNTNQEELSLYEKNF